MHAPPRENASVFCVRMSEPISEFRELLEELKDSVVSISVRLSSVEQAVSDTYASGVIRDREEGLEAAAVPLPTVNIPPSAPDPGVEFNRIKSSVAACKLPPELTLQETKQGIRKADQQVFAVISRCARFAETTLKLLCAQDRIDGEAILSVMKAQMRYLQDEYAGIVVSNSFDPTVARFFRSLQRNTSLSPMAMDNLRSAASIASVYRPANTPPQRGGLHGGFQQRYHGYHGTRGFAGTGGDRQDIFAQQSNRGFPHSRGSFRRGDSAASVSQGE